MTAPAVPIPSPGVLTCTKPWAKNEPIYDGNKLCTAERFLPASTDTARVPNTLDSALTDSAVGRTG